MPRVRQRSSGVITLICDIFLISSGDKRANFIFSILFETLLKFISYHPAPISLQFPLNLIHPCTDTYQAANRRQIKAGRSQIWRNGKRYSYCPWCINGYKRPFTGSERRYNTLCPGHSSTLPPHVAHLSPGSITPICRSIKPLSMGLKCATCGGKVDECPGHFGHIELAMPVVHIGFIKEIKSMLDASCKECGRIKLTDEEINNYRTQVSAIDFETTDPEIISSPSI